jgi:hypothetical protein
MSCSPKYAVSALAVTLIFGAALFSCRTADKGQPTLRPVDDSAPKVIPLAQAIEMDPAFQPDIKLRAQWENGIVYVQALNTTNKPIWVDQNNFGVILEGQREVRRFDPKIHHSNFAKVNIGRGEVATGRLSFPDLGKLVNQRLVFWHPAVRPSVALIEGEGAMPAVKIEDALKQIREDQQSHGTMSKSQPPPTASPTPVVPWPAPALTPAAPTPAPDMNSFALPTPFPEE